jgi:hypothetical protein
MPEGSLRSRSREACWGRRGIASPQPMVTTTSAAWTAWVVKQLGAGFVQVDADLGHGGGDGGLIAAAGRPFGSVRHCGCTRTAPTAVEFCRELVTVRTASEPSIYGRSSSSNALNSSTTGASGVGLPRRHGPVDPVAHHASIAAAGVVPSPSCRSPAVATRNRGLRQACQVRCRPPGREDVDDFR